MYYIRDNPSEDSSKILLKSLTMATTGPTWPSCIETHMFPRPSESVSIQL